MPKWLIAVLACVITVLIGVNGYLFYSYFTFNNNPQQNTDTTNATPAPKITLSGEIKPGWQLPQGQNFCPKSYYLVSDTQTVEIKPEPTAAILDYRIYSNSKMNITGTMQKANNESCGDFIKVETLGSLGQNTQPITITGQVACLPGSEESPEGCIVSLQVGAVYLALTKDSVVISDLTVGDKLKVTGTVDQTFTNPDSFDGGFIASSIEKI